MAANQKELLADILGGISGKLPLSSTIPYTSSELAAGFEKKLCFAVGVECLDV